MAKKKFGAKEEDAEKVHGKYELADKEFQPVLKQLYERNRENEGTDDHMPFNVEPEKIICLRLTSGGGKKYAYVKPIKNEYALLTQAKYFMVICNDQFNVIPIERQLYVITHEYCHCWWNVETQEYETLDHDVKDFSFLLKEKGEWNTDIAKGIKYEQKYLFGDVPKDNIAIKE